MNVVIPRMNNQSAHFRAENHAFLLNSVDLQVILDTNLKLNIKIK